MVKYRGKYPNRVNSVSSSGKGIAIVSVNDGSQFYVLASDNNLEFPKLGVEISEYVAYPRISVLAFVNNRKNVNRFNPDDFAGRYEHGILTDDDIRALEGK